MAIDLLVECDYCGTTINTEQSERCPKCTKYINEDPIEFDKSISNNFDKQEEIFNKKKRDIIKNI